MNGTVWIRVRDVKKSKRNPKGKSYQVVYRRAGGRRARQEHGGSFPTEKLAEARAKLIEVELAFGRDPQALFTVEPVVAAPVKRVFEEWFDAWHATRVDVEDSSASTYGGHRSRLVEAFAGRDPWSITKDEVQALAIGWLTAEKPLKASSITQYIKTLRSVLSFAGVDPNPAAPATAAHPNGVRLPKVEKVQKRFLTRVEFLTVLEYVQDKHALFLRLLEATGVRISEFLNLLCEDVEWDNNRVLLFKTKNDVARWVEIPEPLMLRMGELVPEEERVRGRRVFAEVKSDDAVRADWNAACELAGIEGVTPHSLRHRRISLWLRQGVDVKTVMERVGHLRKGETLDTYAKVVLVDDDEWNVKSAEVRV